MTDFKLPGFNTLKNCRFGPMLYNPNDTHIGRSLDLYGEYCREETLLFDQLLKDDDIVLDIGAHMGAHTIYFAGKVGPKGGVLAFEPQRALYQILCANVALNSFLNVYAYNIALGQEKDFIKVPQLNYAKETNFGLFTPKDYNQGDDVALETIDTWMALPKCKLIKIDVEGMEMEVIKGAENTIKSTAPYIYYEDNAHKPNNELNAYVKSLGYKLYWHFPRYFRSDNFFGNSKNVFENNGNLVTASNIIAVPKGATTPQSVAREVTLG
jgi:FkbM family methyltransferase